MSLTPQSLKEWIEGSGVDEAIALANQSTHL
jgi:hypothetical protein